MRPRFELLVPFAPDEVHQRVQHRQACSGCPCRADVVGRHIEVHIREGLRHFWSPRLSLEVQEHAEGAELHGLYGPNPNVWTLFMAGYAFATFVALFGGVFGLVQLGLGQTAWGLAFPMGALLFAVLLYGGSIVGQRLAAEQMTLLRCFLEESIGLPHERAVSTDCPPAARALPIVQEQG